MKTRNLSTGTFILGALGAMAASIAACSAQSSGSPPRGNGSSGQTSSTGGSGNSAAGSTVILGGGTTGNPGSAGTFGSGTAGTFGTGAGGTFGTGVGGTGTGTAGTGTGTGTGGAAAMSCGSLTVAPADSMCCVAAGTATDLSVDDLEDMNNAILPLGNRQGYWYSYKDAGSTLMPATTPIPVATGGHGGMYSIGISGMVAAATATVPAYAGLGFDLNNHFKKSCPYGASAYHGISFWAKGTVPFKISIKISATTAASSLSVGTCAAMCDDHYSKTVAPPPDGTTWGQVNVMFADLKQAGWGTVVPAFDAANILAVQFQLDGLTTQTGPVAYAFAIDNVAFLP